MVFQLNWNLEMIKLLRISHHIACRGTDLAMWNTTIKSLQRKKKTAGKKTHSPNESTQMPPKKASSSRCWEVLILWKRQRRTCPSWSFDIWCRPQYPRYMITELGETKLTTRMVGGDLSAPEAKYHMQCLVKLRNQYCRLSRKLNQNSENTDEKMNESRAFVELTTYMKKTVESGINLFKLTDIHSLYISRLKELGVEKPVNNTRLKSCLLEHFAEAQEQHDGRHALLILKEGMKDMLKDAPRKWNFDKDAVTLAKAAKIIRNDILNHDSFKFTGSFPTGCQEKSIPSSLKYLVAMITKGPNLKNKETCDSQACLTIGQAIMYNTTKNQLQQPWRLDTLWNESLHFPYTLAWINLQGYTKWAPA